MLATRWNPRDMWGELNRMRHELDRMFSGEGGRGGPLLSGAVYPPLNLWEDEDHLYVEAELPGFELDDLDITVTGENQLSLKGTRKSPELEGGAWHRRERGFGSFSRMIELPQHVNPEDVDAEFKYGVLTLRMAKKEEAKPRRIEVKSD